MNGTIISRESVVLKDDHPGKWNEGVEVYLADAWIARDEREFEDGDKFVTCVRVPGTPTLGMFGENEACLQHVARREDGDWALTMYNEFTITKEQQDRLIRDGEILIENRLLTDEQLQRFMDLPLPRPHEFPIGEGMLCLKCRITLR